MACPMSPILLPAILGDSQEFCGLLVHLPDREGVRGVTVVALVYSSTVDGHYIALAELVVRRKTVDHDVVDGQT